MNNLNLNLMNSVLPRTQPDGIQPTDEASKARKEQFAKDFESVFIEKLLDEMKNTIGEWGFEQDGAAKQTQGLFWMHLARDVSAKGGLGMWKDIYHSLEKPEQTAGTTELLDKKL